MSANKTDISQIRRYHNGELDAKAMHRLEREAQDDPFLMDALEGYETSGKDQQANLYELQQRLSDRVAPKAERSIVLWRVLPLAASLLIAISVGYYFLEHNKAEQKAANVSLSKVVLLPPKSDEPAPNPSYDKAEKASSQPTLARNTVKHKRLNPMLAANRSITTTYKADTVEYKASAYPVKPNAAVEELLKKMKGMEVGSDGTITHQGVAINPIRINGKDYKGGNVANATKSLPADILGKIQTVDDYGDQASKKTVDPTQLAAIKPDTIKQSRFAKGSLQGRLPGTDLNEVQIRGTSAVSKKELTQSIATIPAKDISKPWRDSVTSLAEVVVVGHPDNNPQAGKAQPLNGWKGYLAYIVQQAVMPDGAIGKVKLAFTIGSDGKISGIRVIRGRNPAMNDRAIAIIQNGPQWMGEAKQKEVKLKIRFHKKTNG